MIHQINGKEFKTIQEQKNHVFQIFLLPKDDLLEPSSYFAFCPFSKLHSEGSSINEAVENFIKVANEHFDTKIHELPSFLSRKVWAAEVQEKPIYVIDFNKNIGTDPVVICPVTELYGNLDLSQVIGFATDWKVCCSPIIFVTEDEPVNNNNQSYLTNRYNNNSYYNSQECSNSYLTLTPHYIN
eukprot:TRINITY_DN1967_c2_g1_i1.p1 TRINITY_DN1967_c2_g1~~TRINITY_DN1967_c2_g1_i1.p1  ORF type:complete len:184 (+),score=19.34 TRINITY_DN1967_c2_g1_i1:96-647(+)